MTLRELSGETKCPTGVIALEKPTVKTFPEAFYAWRKARVYEIK